MATDGDQVEDLDDDVETPDDDHLRTLIREEIASALEGLTPGGGSPAPDDGPADTTGMSVKDIESATERAVRRAMDDLARKAGATKRKAASAPKKPAPDPEPTPDAPPTNWLDKVKKAAWS